MNTTAPVYFENNPDQGPCMNGWQGLIFPVDHLLGTPYLLYYPCLNKEY